MRERFNKIKNRLNEDTYSIVSTLAIIPMSIAFGAFMIYMDHNEKQNLEMSTSHEAHHQKREAEAIESYENYQKIQRRSLHETAEYNKEIRKSFLSLN